MISEIDNTEPSNLAGKLETLLNSKDGMGFNQAINAQFKAIMSHNDMDACRKLHSLKDLILAVDSAHTSLTKANDNGNLKMLSLECIKAIQALTNEASQIQFLLDALHAEQEANLTVEAAYEEVSGLFKKDNSPYNGIDILSVFHLSDRFGQAVYYADNEKKTYDPLPRKSGGIKGFELTY